MVWCVQGKQFVEFQVFGVIFFELFGKELVIVFYGCDFVGDEDGEVVVFELCIVVNVRVVYVGKGMVYFNVSKEGCFMVICSKVMVVYWIDKIEVLGGNQVLVFDI